MQAMIEVSRSIAHRYFVRSCCRLLSCLKESGCHRLKNDKLTVLRPDNLINIILNGVREPATQDIGYMPAFKYALSDAQIAELANYMRSRYAPGEAAWRNLPADIARLRKTDVN